MVRRINMKAGIYKIKTKDGRLLLAELRTDSNIPTLHLSDGHYDNYDNIADLSYCMEEASKEEKFLFEVRGSWALSSNIVDSFGICHNDLDGISCKYLMMQHGIPESNIFEVDYPETNVDNIIEEKILILKDIAPNVCIQLIIADIAPSESMCNKLDILLKEYKITNIIVADHHKTIKHFAEKYDWFYYNEDMSGAEGLAIKLGNMEKYNEWLRLVTVYDLWKLDDPLRKMAENINVLFKQLGSKIFFEIMKKSNITTLKWQSHQLNSDALMGAVVNAKDLLDATQDAEKLYINDALNRLHIATDHNDRLFAWIVGKHSMVSDLSKKIFEDPDRRSIDYFLNICFESGVVSLRSAKIDVSEIAKDRGGGGHSGAAGYSLPSNWEHLLIKDIICAKELL